ncbi:MAG: hypothetical protein GF416_06330 [Candidatus Altiarchaeales archaeon]|nr:hypothetical protein [Candidatus Altiarchaeales archaeon]MBD3416732.1 hypothetical protein [Candidatus Altiarchaeales archaeon]
MAATRRVERIGFDGDLPRIIAHPVDEQIVVLRNPDVPFRRDGKHVEGPVVMTRGGIGYVVGSNRLDARDESPERAAELVRMKDSMDRGEITITTPYDIYTGGLFGDKSKLAIVFTSGGEGSSIGVNNAEVTRELSSTHVVLGAWQGFQAGVKTTEEFARQLTVLNDPATTERMSRTGGSTLGMSRTKVRFDSENPEDIEAAENLFTNVRYVGVVFGNGGGDHTQNFMNLYLKAQAEGASQIVIGVTPKSMDNDLAINLNDGTIANSLMLGFPTTAYVMRRHFLDEMQSAAGAGRGTVGFFFGRGAGWTVLGAIRNDMEYRENMREDGILTADMENKMDSLGPRTIGLVPEYPVSIPYFAASINKIYNEGSIDGQGGEVRDKFVGVAVSEGFMFTELISEFERLTREREEGRLTEEIVIEKVSRNDLEDLIEDENVKRIMGENPEMAKKFFEQVMKPKLDVWEHPKVDFGPQFVHAVMNSSLTDVPKNNYAEIKYEARTGETVPADRALGEVTGRVEAETIRAGRSGVTTVTYEAGEDPLLIDPRKRGASFIPFEDIAGMSEDQNNLRTLDPNYLRKLGILIEPHFEMPA